MKTLIAVLTLTAAFEVNARSIIHPEEGPTFVECSDSDLSVFEVARSSALPGLDDVVRNEVLANKVACKVSKPRYFHPAVCGAVISQVDTYIFTTNNATVEVVVDSSYRSCYRDIVIPDIKSLIFNQIDFLGE